MYKANFIVYIYIFIKLFHYVDIFFFNLIFNMFQVVNKSRQQKKFFFSTKL